MHSVDKSRKRNRVSCSSTRTCLAFPFFQKYFSCSVLTPAAATLHPLATFIPISAVWAPPPIAFSRRHRLCLSVSYWSPPSSTRTGAGGGFFFFLLTGTLRERVQAGEWGGWIATSRELDWLSASAPRWTDAAVKQASAPLSNAPCFASQSAPLLHSGSSQRNQRLRKSFIYMLVFDGFLLTRRGAAAIYLCTFKATKLRITVISTAQTCLKRQLSHFPGGESPAGYGCCFCQELHMLWSRLNKKHCSS